MLARGCLEANAGPPSAKTRRRAMDDLATASELRPDDPRAVRLRASFVIKLSGRPAAPPTRCTLYPVQCALYPVPRRASNPRPFAPPRREPSD